MLSAETPALSRATSNIEQDAQGLVHLNFEFLQCWRSTDSLGPVVTVLHQLPGELFFEEEWFFLLQLVSLFVHLWEEADSISPATSFSQMKRPVKKNPFVLSSAGWTNPTSQPFFLWCPVPQLLGHLCSHPPRRPCSILLMSFLFWGDKTGHADS